MSKWKAETERHRPPPPANMNEAFLNIREYEMIPLEDGEAGLRLEDPGSFYELSQGKGESDDNYRMRVARAWHEWALSVLAGKRKSDGWSDSRKAAVGALLYLRLRSEKMQPYLARLDDWPELPDRRLYTLVGAMSKVSPSLIGRAVRAYDSVKFRAILVGSDQRFDLHEKTLPQNITILSEPMDSSLGKLRDAFDLVVVQGDFAKAESLPVSQLVRTVKRGKFLMALHKDTDGWLWMKSIGYGWSPMPLAILIMQPELAAEQRWKQSSIRPVSWTFLTTYCHTEHIDWQRHQLAHKDVYCLWREAAKQPRGYLANTWKQILNDRCPRGGSVLGLNLYHLTLRALVEATKRTKRRLTIDRSSEQNWEQ